MIPPFSPLNYPFKGLRVEEIGQAERQN